MQNLYERAKYHPIFQKFQASETLFTEYQCMEEHSIFKIWSQFNYFVYVLSGKKLWKTTSGEYIVYAGESLFVRKGANIIHKFFEEDFCALIIFLPDEFIKNNIRDMERPAKITDESASADVVIPVELDHTLKAYFESLYAYFTNEEKPPPDLLQLKFKELIMNIVTLRSNDVLTHYFRRLCRQTKLDIEDIMEENFRYNLSLDAFAQLSERSLTAFKRDFQKIYKMAPGRWLTQKRLEYAKQLMENTSYSVSELVFECGFENPSHFSRVFKEKYGMPPHQYQMSFRT